MVGALLTLPGASYLAGLTAIHKQNLSTAVTVLVVIGFNIVMLWLLENLHWVVLAFVILFGIEAFFVLRRFARLEAERLGKQP